MYEDLRQYDAPYNALQYGEIRLEYAKRRENTLVVEKLVKSDAQLIYIRSLIFIEGVEAVAKT